MLFARRRDNANFATAKSRKDQSKNNGTMLETPQGKRADKLNLILGFDTKNKF